MTNLAEFWLHLWCQQLALYWIGLSQRIALAYFLDFIAVRKAALDNVGKSTSFLIYFLFLLFIIIFYYFLMAV